MSDSALDLTLAGFCSEAYTAEPNWNVAGLPAICRRTPDGRIVIAIRGTADARGWLRDFDAALVDDETLGVCHRGFRDGARALFHAIGPAAFEGVLLTGHSLGAALAVLLGALAISAGSAPAQVVGFGPPRAGGRTVGRVLTARPTRLYRHGNDPVPEVPFLPGLLAHPVPLTSIGTPCEDPFEAHPIERYIAALGGARDA